MNSIKVRHNNLHRLKQIPAMAQGCRSQTLAKMDLFFIGGGRVLLPWIYRTTQSTTIARLRPFISCLSAVYQFLMITIHVSIITVYKSPAKATQISDLLTWQHYCCGAHPCMCPPSRETMTNIDNNNQLVRKINIPTHINISMMHAPPEPAACNK